jgi:hypothetical protein
MCPIVPDSLVAEVSGRPRGSVGLLLLLNHPLNDGRGAHRSSVPVGGNGGNNKLRILIRRIKVVTIDGERG